MALDFTRRPNFARHKDNGFFVVAYPDAPGEYYDEAGNRVTDKIAKEAGYNVAEDRVAREKTRQIQKARDDAETEAQRKIAEIRAAQSGGAERESVLTASIGPDGFYRVADVHGNELKSGINFEEAFAAVALANGFDGAQPMVEPALTKAGKPTGDFNVVVGDRMVGEKLPRGEAEALALKQIGG